MTSRNVLVAVIASILGVAGPIAVLVAANQTRQTALLVAFAFVCLAVAVVTLGAALCGDREDPDLKGLPSVCDGPVCPKGDAHGSQGQMRFEGESHPRLTLGAR